MRIAQYAAEIRNLTITANALDVTLPADFTEQAAHLADLATEQRPAPNPVVLATTLAQHLGNPAAMTKARAKAAADLAAAEAHAKISAALTERCAAALHQRMRSDRETIAAAFGETLAPHLDTLTTEAPKLPTAFTPEQAADLDPVTYTAWSAARDAHAALEATRRALDPIYATRATELLTITAMHALRYTAPPARFTDYTHAHRFVRALAGTRHGGSNLGALNVQGVFAPTACAELGGTFAWATPAEVDRRVDALTAAVVPPVVTREQQQRNDTPVVVLL